MGWREYNKFEMLRQFYLLMLLLDKIDDMAQKNLCCGCQPDQKSNDVWQMAL